VASPEQLFTTVHRIASATPGISAAIRGSGYGPRNGLCKL